MEKLDQLTVKQKLDGLKGWQVVDGKWLMKRYRFQTYLDGIGFVNEIAELSERENHHPFITIEYKLITVKLTSWSSGGITHLDLRLIGKYDHIYEKRDK